MIRQTGTRKVPRGEAMTGLTKAREFIESARQETAASRWNSAGLTAIHAAISAVDAALVASAGQHEDDQGVILYGMNITLERLLACHVL